MNTFFTISRTTHFVFAILLSTLWFIGATVPAHASFDTEQTAHMDAQLDEATAILTNLLTMVPQADVLGASTSTVEKALLPSNDKNVTALQAQLKAIMSQRDTLSKKIAELNAQIVVLKTKIEQLVKPVPVPLKPTPRFNGYAAPGSPLVTVSAVFAAPAVQKGTTGPVALGKINWGDSITENVSALVTGTQIFVDLKHTYKAAGTYTITFTDLKGKTATQKVVVNSMVSKAPTCDSFTASPSTLGVGGGNVTFSWATSNATDVSSERLGDLPVDGSKVVLVKQTTEYVLNVKNAVGSVQCSVSVEVSGPTLYSISNSITKLENSPTITTDNSGEFKFKFEVTAMGSDVYVPSTALRGAASSMGAGISFKVFNSASVEVTTGSTSQALSSSATTEGAYFVVHEGETEIFTLTVNFDPATQAAYSVGLVNLNWNDSVGVPDTSTPFTPVADFRTDSIII